ncbi:hypothetical protein HIM_09587 [Hirsutella minnesotensis 3608]|uniref:Uncharacterized protein n=1 Tax=Hirsutella minnesotensis 3608 TaxID=1043627 RepID=A0A0F7ZXN3_9HYPO|nr:hypothetical protein HIM_09587 [Hirsutella minnesotensis 3608]
MTLKTGCSASLVALHEAARAIQSGDAAGAIVAGTSLLLSPTSMAALAADGIISPDGSCKTFDSGANGFARAEGITAVFIKPLAAALRDGNPIRAVIRATGTNSDGRSDGGLFNPNDAAQEALIRKVYGSANLDPCQTAFVECHGTGTAAGDPAETRAIGRVFGKEGIYIGSVKPNIGHGEGTSGLNSLIKAVLALEHRMIPPNIKFSQPNPKILFVEKRLKVPVQPTPFPSDRAERISINSFGLGGTNAHVVVDSYHMLPSTANSMGQVKPQLLAFSANTLSSLQRQIQQYHDFLCSTADVNVADLAYTLATRRTKMPHRAFSIVKDGGVVTTSPPLKAVLKPLNVYLIFTGQGAQWPGMGKELVDTDAAFRDDITAMDGIIRNLINPPKWSLLEELVQEQENSRIHEAELSQPLCTAIQVALVNKLSRAGLKAAGAVGHSSGEIAAAYAAGAISMEAAITIAYYRGYVTKGCIPKGSMAAVNMGRNEVSSYLREGVVIACENSPISVTLSGDTDKIHEATERIKSERRDSLVRLLKVDVAYHSDHMAIAAEKYSKLLHHELEGFRKWNFTPSIPVVSSLTGEVMDGNTPFDPTYWVRNLVSPVLFSKAVGKLLERSGDGVFLEIGPHSALRGPLRQITAHVSKPCNYQSVLQRGSDSAVSFLSAIGSLYQQGVTVDLGSFFAGNATLSNLPTYPWDHTDSFWYESRISRAWRSRKFPHHCLLGSRTPQSPDTERQWRNILLLENEPWISQHRVNEDTVFPMACYVAMAGEAVRQLSGFDTGYSIRHTVGLLSLVLRENQPCEIVTSLRPYYLSDWDKSEWYEFAISSFNGSTWVLHCRGQVKALNTVCASSVELEDLPRKVAQSRFYDHMADVGFNFGPAFQLIENATTNPMGQYVSAHVAEPGEVHCDPFIMHPTLIDAAIQLLILAGCDGLTRNIKKLNVPTLIEHLDVRPSNTRMTARAWGASKVSMETVEYSVDGKTYLLLKGVKMTVLEDNTVVEEDAHSGARLQWLPDFDFIDAVNLCKPPSWDHECIRLLEEMTTLCIIESFESVNGLAPAKPHLNKQRAWLHSQVNKARADQINMVSNSLEYLSLTPAERKKGIEVKYEMLQETAAGCHATALKRVCERYIPIFIGEVEPLDALMQDDLLAQIYKNLSFDYSDFIRLLSGTNPTLRILEVGAGTGGTTKIILDNMTRDGGLPWYSTYTFTDISAAFFPQAKQIFANAPNMEYKVFDITKSPLEQGLEASTYDLIVAANVVHATPSLRESLSNLNMLLKPGGTLLLTEIVGEVRHVSYIVGNLPGWWLGEGDNRLNAPFVSSSRWSEELLASGFSDVNTATYGKDAISSPYATIIAKRNQVATAPRSANVTLVTSNPASEVSNSLIAALKTASFSVSLLSMSDELPPDMDVIVSVDLEEHFFEDIEEAAFKAYQKLASSVNMGQKVLWLSPPAQIKCQDPRSSQSIGAARAIRSELGVCFCTLEISIDEDHLGELVLKVFDKIRRGQDDNNLDCDTEYVVDNGIICIGRYQPFALMDESAALSVCNEMTFQTLEVGRAGMIETLQWAEKTLPKVLSGNSLQVQVRCTGLNLRDLLLATGVIDKSVAPGLGYEVSGIITRLGSEVHGFRIGDRVCGLCPGSGLATTVIAEEHMVSKMPDSMSFEEAATIPVAYLVAVQSLLGICGLNKDQTVLIHSACGGVHMASIQICKMVGAEFFVTVGDEEVSNYLTDSLGIPPSHIFSSRDESFFDDVMRATKNRGVDIVLNALSGSLLHASWKCVAEFGTMFEFGKRDMLGYGKLDLHHFLGNRRFVYLDGVDFSKHRPDEIRSVFSTFFEAYQRGELGPLPRVSQFPASDVVAAFRHLQGGNNIGKVVIAFPNDSSAIVGTPTREPITFDPTGTYLLTGGFGGLGRSMATWLVERGAKSLVFLSRSAGTSAQSQACIRELESMGCNVVAVTGSAECLGDVKVAICAAKTTIKGVFHLAMVLRDCSMTDMTWSMWKDAILPKVKGAWNLHNALQGHALDFLWLASSVVTIFDQHGQGNYVASNVFLEAFCQYRLSQGLPTAVLNICPIKDVGFISETVSLQQSDKMRPIYLLREKDYLGEREFLDFVEFSLFSATKLTKEYNTAPGKSESLVTWHNSNQIVMGLQSELHLEDPDNHITWRRNRRMGRYHNIPAKNKALAASGGTTIQLFLNRLSEKTNALIDKAAIAFVGEQIGDRICELMLKPAGDINLEMSLAQIGIDSLMATELRRWFRQVWGVQVTVLEMTSLASVSQLANVVAEKLMIKYASS